MIPGDLIDLNLTLAGCNQRGHCALLYSVIFKNCLGSDQWKSGYTGVSCSSSPEQPGGLPGAVQTFRLCFSCSAELPPSVTYCWLAAHPSQASCSGACVLVRFSAWRGVSYMCCCVYHRESTIQERHLYFKGKGDVVFDVLRFILCSQVDPLSCTGHCFPRKRGSNPIGRSSTTPSS